MIYHVLFAYELICSPEYITLDWIIGLIVWIYILQLILFINWKYDPQCIDSIYCKLWITMKRIPSLLCQTDKKIYVFTKLWFISIRITSDR